MKNIKKIFVVLMTLMMLCTMAACGIIFSYKNNSFGPYEFNGFNVCSSCNLCNSNYNLYVSNCDLLLIYRSITDTVITETNGGDRMDTTKIRTDEE